MGKNLLFFLIFLLFPLYSEDFEFIVNVPQNRLDNLVLKIIEEALLATGSTVYFTFDTKAENHEISWGYPEAVSLEWVKVSDQLLGGFAGFATVRATEEDLGELAKVVNLSQLKSLPLEAVFHAKAPWLTHWQRNGLAYRIDNSGFDTVKRGVYKVVSLWELSLEVEKSNLPIAPLQILFKANTDLALYVNPLRVNQSRREMFRNILAHGLMLIQNNQRLNFLLRQAFLPVFTEFKIERLNVIQIRN